MRNILAAAALVTAGLAGSAGAAVVTYDFAATGFTGDATNLLAAIGGAPVTGRITFDDATGVDDGSYFGPDDYRINSVYFFASLSITFNGTTYQVEYPNFVFSEDINSNVDWFDSSSNFRVVHNNFSGPPGVTQGLFDGFTLDVSARGATTWDGVTPTVAQLNAASDRYAEFIIGGQYLNTRNVTFSSPVVSPVPLPAGGVLLVSAIAGLALTRRRRA